MPQVPEQSHAMQTCAWKMGLTRPMGRAESASTAPGARVTLPGSPTRGLALPGVDFSKLLLDKTTSPLWCIELNAANWAQKDTESYYIFTQSLVHGFQYLQRLIACLHFAIKLLMYK